jgi:hypothetical protein
MKRVALSFVVVLAGMVAFLSAADVAGSWKLDVAIGEFPIDLVC